MARMLRAALLAAALMAAFTVTGRAQAPATGAVRIGVLEDMSTAMGDTFGQGEVVAARLAVEDFGDTVLGRPVELVSADHQSKPDVASSIARRWLDQDGVTMITGLANSAIAIGVQGLARERGRVTIITGSGSIDITGKQCSPTGAHWVIDTYALAHAVAQPLVQEGLDTWFYVVADITLGRSLVHDVTPVVEAGGGRVVGQTMHPLLTTDMAAPMLQAIASHAKVVALMDVGGDAVNAIKQAAEFGLMQGGGQQLAGLYLTVTDVHAVGLATARGIYLAEAYYGDLDDATRAFARRYAERMSGRMPNSYQAGVYSAVLHYLEAVRAAGTDEAGAVMVKMRELPVEDFMTHGGKLREDGRLIRDVYLLQAKRPEEAHGEWDLLRRVATLPGEQAFRPLAESECPLVRRH